MKMGMSGVKEMLKNVDKSVERVRKAAAAALFLEGQLQMTEAKLRCPVAEHDGGVLQASGIVSKPQSKGNRMWVELSFGGAASAYAIAVHEHLSVHSPPSWKIAEAHGNGVHWHRPGSGPKFLESAMNEAKPTVNERLARRIKATLAA
jgi:hypothetical protein